MFDLGLTLPFTLGLVTAINPCGFAMLPTWIGYFLAGDAADREDRPEQVLRGLLVSLVMAGAFILVFGTLGLAVTHLVTEESIARRPPWITVLVGLFLIGYGLALLTGRRVRLPIPKPRRGPESSELWSVFGFGVSYAIVSVGCAAPIFLLQVAGSFGRAGILDGPAPTLAFAAGGTAAAAGAGPSAGGGWELPPLLSPQVGYFIYFDRKVRIALKMFDPAKPYDSEIHFMWNQNLIRTNGPIP